MHSLTQEFERSGRVWIRGALSKPQIEALAATIDLDKRPGQRLDAQAGLKSALADGPIGKTVNDIAPGARPVRAVAFNKSQENNWGVPWHQDRVIAVSERHDVDGFGNWTRKAGYWHCEPPSDLWDRMFFVRIHLDHSDGHNGTMQIARGSHREGIVSSAKAEEIARACPIEDCTAEAGDILILKMLTLHASKPSNTTAPRRALRVDYALASLPSPLEWATME